MKQKLLNKSYKKVLQKKDLLEDFKMSLLDFNFVMIYITHKMLALLRNPQSYLKNSTFECFFKEYNRRLIFF